MGPPRKWEIVSSEDLQDCRVFRVVRNHARSPRSGEVHPFYCIEAAPWVNVVALTPDDELVLVRQFRHGSRGVTLEIPGGLVDPGEAPGEAAVRELLEETGYGGGRSPQEIGRVNPNPALFTNAVHTFVVRDVTQVAPIANSGTEETAVELVPRRSLRALLERGEIDHALVIAGLFWFSLREGLAP
jgi:8-oxo-dGTP pyrophosphatase MutT (NUDIX family)